VTDGEVNFEDWSDHEVLLTGDDTDLYATTQATEGGAGQIDAFRDPWYHRDEETGEEYLLFTATMPRAECEGDGVVGIARATGDDLQDWELSPPMFDGHCVNNELERPHIVIEGGLTICCSPRTRTPSATAPRARRVCTDSWPMTSSGPTSR
jgi:levansucrase